MFKQTMKAVSKAYIALSQAMQPQQTTLGGRFGKQDWHVSMWGHPVTPRAASNDGGASRANPATLAPVLVNSQRPGNRPAALRWFPPGHVPRIGGRWLCVVPQAVDEEDIIPHIEVLPCRVVPDTPYRSAPPLLPSAGLLLYSIHRGVIYKGGL